MDREGEMGRSSEKNKGLVVSLPEEEMGGGKVGGQEDLLSPGQRDDEKGRHGWLRLHPRATFCHPRNRGWEIQIGV